LSKKQSSNIGGVFIIIIELPVQFVSAYIGPADNTKIPKINSRPFKNNLILNYKPLITKRNDLLSKVKMDSEKNFINFSGSITA